MRISWVNCFDRSLLYWSMTSSDEPSRSRPSEIRSFFSAVIEVIVAKSASYSTRPIGFGLSVQKGVQRQIADITAEIGDRHPSGPSKKDGVRIGRCIDAGEREIGRESLRERVCQ